MYNNILKKYGVDALSPADRLVSSSELMSRRENGEYVHPDGVLQASQSR